VQGITAMKAIWQVIGVSAVLHGILVIYSEWHDRNFMFKYTDIDYWVFTDAARAVAAGLPPYARPTYRYTPFLAWLLLPAHWIHESFGKVLFSFVDLIVGFLIYRLLRLKGWYSLDAARYAAFFWLLNPVALAISTRGNAESLVCACVLGVIYLLLTRKRGAAAVLFGVAVHFKLFPIIYAPSILLFLGLIHGLAERRHTKDGEALEQSSSMASIHMDPIPSGHASALSSLVPSSSQIGIGLRGLAPIGVRLSSSPLVRSASPNRLAESLSAASVGLGGAISASSSHLPNLASSALLLHRRHQTSPVKTMCISRHDLHEDVPLLDGGLIKPCKARQIVDHSGTKITIHPPSHVLVSLFNGRITFKSSHAMFSFISCVVFASLTAISYALYGKMFWEEALMYHLVRKDHRHNFSPYFLPFYLESVQALPSWLSLATFIPQLLLLIAIAWKYARRDLPFAAFLQTFVFVTFNKVCTSQYFLWYLCFVPIISTSLRRMSPVKWVLISVVWLAGQAVWLHYNYLFEHLGRNTFMEMWLSALAFLSINVLLIGFFIKHHFLAVKI